ncbi:MAG: iron ABC transporter permease [candidate division WOR-3 bacterium]
MRKAGWMTWLGFVVLLLAMSALTLAVGPGGLAKHRLAQVLDFRLPRLLLGIMAGGVLATAGAGLQGLLRNPLADPFTLGVSSGAALGVSLVLVSGHGSTLLLPLGGFAGALIATFVVYLLARVRGRLTMTGLVLSGVIASFFFASLMMLIMIVGRRTLGEAVYLTMGHLGVVVTRRSVWLLVVAATAALAGCGWLFAQARALDVMSLSEETARSLGIDAGRLTRRAFVVLSLAVGMVVSFTGAISFVGLVVPHLTRLLLGPMHRRLLPGSFVLGAGVLLASDLVARNLVPGGLPLSVVTALVGVPFFVYLLRTRL